MPILTLRKLIESYSISKIRANIEVQRQYSLAIKAFNHRHIDSGKKFAVIVHLFYTDNWLLFKSKLSILQRVVDFDLFITLPEENLSFLEIIKVDFPKAEYMQCPNRGRDVLPFINVARQLDILGFECILKFHSKKSTHWDGGQTWLEHTLHQIIPENEQLLTEITKKIAEKSTGVIGPAEYYYPLTVNFPANGWHLSKFIIKFFGRDSERKYLQVHRDLYGFFGGTMLWVRMDAIREVLSSRIEQFEVEKGQIDGTYAHAVERLLCLLPEIKGRQNFECDGSELRLRPYDSQNIPDWSTDHDK